MKLTLEERKSLIITVIDRLDTALQILDEREQAGIETSKVLINNMMDEIHRLV